MMTEDSVCALLEKLARQYHGLVQGLQRHRPPEQQEHAPEFAACHHPDCTAVRRLTRGPASAD